MVLSKTVRCLMLDVLRKSLNGAVAEVGHNNTKKNYLLEDNYWKKYGCLRSEHMQFEFDHVPHMVTSFFFSPPPPPYNIIVVL